VTGGRDAEKEEDKAYITPALSQSVGRVFDCGSWRRGFFSRRGMISRQVPKVEHVDADGPDSFSDRIARRCRGAAALSSLAADIRPTMAGSAAGRQAADRARQRPLRPCCGRLQLSIAPQFDAAVVLAPDTKGARPAADEQRQASKEDSDRGPTCRDRAGSLPRPDRPQGSGFSGRRRIGFERMRSGG